MPPLPLSQNRRGQLLFYILFPIISEEADRVLDNEMGMIDLPHGLPTFGSIEAGRLKQKDTERVQKVNDLYL